MPRQVILVLGLCLGLLISVNAFANPQGPQVVHGQVGFSNPNSHTLNVTNSPNAIINWQGFSIPQNEITRFIQQSANSAVLNRVIGQNPSQLLGQMLSNGLVFLINPHGMVFGPHCKIDTAGFVASTLNITDQDFLDGKLRFQKGADSGSIVNHGFITAGKNGDIYLIAPNIENSGIIHTEGGNLLLCAGESITITSMDLKGVHFEVQSPENEIVNLGKVLVDGGAVGIFAGTLKHSGEIRADTVSMDETGTVILSASHNVTLESQSILSASGPIGGTVHVESKNDTAWIAGTVEAKGSQGQGGDVCLLGERVAVIDSAFVNVSGETGGGKVLVGGDYRGENQKIQNARQTYVSEDARITANAIKNGDGGKIVVWANESTQMYGKLSARGGELGGDGGFVETSGKRLLDVGKTPPDVSAPKGRGGVWLLDPENITISTAGNNNITASSPFLPSAAGSSILNTTTLNTALGSGITVIVDTTGGGAGTGNINVNESVTKSSGADSMLELRAHNDIYINAQITSSSNKLDLKLVANQDTSGGGEITIANDINTNGGLIDAQSSGSGIVNFSGSPTISATSFNVESINISSGTVTLNTNTLNLSGGTIQGTGNITVNGDLTLNAGNLIVQSGSNLTSNNSNIAQIAGSNASVTIDGGTWANNGVLTVGGGGTGTLTIDSGGTVTSAGGGIGQDTGGDGTVNIINGSWTSTGFLGIGFSGTGALTIESNGALTSNNTNLGQLAGSSGTVTINGGTWTDNGAMTVGQGGIGTLTVQNGGTVTSYDGGIGQDTGGDGTVNIVNGNWTTTGHLEVGVAGTGALTVENGGTLTTNNTNIGDQTNGIGSVVLDGGNWTSNGALVIGNFGQGTLTVQNSGTLNSNYTILGEEVGSEGTTIINGVSWTAPGLLGVGMKGTGALTVQNGGNNGNLILNNKVLRGTGTITGNVINSGSVVVGSSPGTLTINGNYVQKAGGSLDIEIGGFSKGVTYDWLNITGIATLDGTLNVDLLGGFIGSVGAKFDIMSYAGGVSGDFANKNLPAGHYYLTGDQGTFYRLVISTLNVVPDILALTENIWQEQPEQKELIAKGSLPDYIEVYEEEEEEGRVRLFCH